MSEPSDAVVRVAVSGDAQRAQGYLPLALALLHRTQDRARAYRVTRLSDQLRLDDDAYCYVTVAPGINQVNVVVDAPAPNAVPDVEPVTIPDFLSGAVHDGYLTTTAATATTPAITKLGTFRPTAACADKFKLDQVLQDSRRLAVQTYADLSYTPVGATGTPSQYTTLRPTMYSGRMRRLIQALMGFGRQLRRGSTETSIYDDGTKDAKPGKPKPKLTTYQKQVVKNGLQIRFDWRFSRTHGVSKGADGALWVIEVGITRGVVAWPLALVPDTTKDAFRKKLEDANDAEALAILDEFGGFPTGEPLPSAKETDAWVRAGRLLQLVSADDMARFYDYTAYSSWMGWAFNMSGTEAHNTAWRYGDDGVQRGAHFMVPITIGASDNVTATAGAQALRDAMLALSGDAYAAGQQAAAWKVSRLSDGQLRVALQQLAISADAAFSYLDPLTLDPLAKGSANLTLMSEGSLWSGPLVGARFVPTSLWFPVPEQGGIVQHDLTPLESSQVTTPPACDTTVFVCFQNDELRWAKFYIETFPDGWGANDPSGMLTNNLLAAQPCDQNLQAITGTTVFTRENSPLGRGGVAAMYTNEFDDRDLVRRTGKEEDVYTKSVDDLGMVDARIEAAAMPGNFTAMARSFGFNATVRYTQRIYAEVRNSVAIPMYDREAYYYALLQRADSPYQVAIEGVQYVGPMWVSDFNYCLGKFNGGDTFPQDYDWSDAQYVNAFLTLPGAPDAGSPFGPGTGVYSWVDRGGWSPPPQPFTTDGTLQQFNEADSVIPTQTRLQHSIWLSTSGSGVFTLRKNTDVSTQAETIDQWPWIASADQVVKLEATGSVLGKATIYRATGGLGDVGTEDERDPRMFGTPEWDGLTQGFLTFIGVING